MRRFLFLTFLGGLSALVGHASLSLGLHAERFVPLAAVVEACIALAVGAALFVTGMLGLAEGFEKQLARLAGLLEAKQAPETDIPAADHLIDRPTGLQASVDQFWRGYISTTGGLLLAFGGLLALVLILGDVTYETYRLTVAAGIIGIALPTFILWARGLARIRRSHVKVVEFALRAERLPEKTAPPIEPSRRPSRGAVFRSARPTISRDLRKTSRRRDPRPGARF